MTKINPDKFMVSTRIKNKNWHLRCLGETPFFVQTLKPTIFETRKEAQKAIMEFLAFNFSNDCDIIPLILISRIR